MFIQHFDWIPTTRTILDRVLEVRVHTLSTQLQFKLFLTRRPSNLHQIHPNIDFNIFRIDRIRLAHISTARSIHLLSMLAYDIGEALMDRTLPNLQTISYTLDYNLNTLKDQPMPHKQVVRPLSYVFDISFVCSFAYSYIHSPAHLYAHLLVQLTL